MKKVKLNLGCGKSILKDFINVDKYYYKGVNFIMDLNIFPYLFKDNYIDYIYMNHVLEHLENSYKVLLECYRILKNNGILEIIVPHRESLNSSDITHRCYFTERSLSHILKNGNSLQSEKLFILQKVKVNRIIELPFKIQLKGFNIYHNRIGIGKKSSIHFILKKVINNEK